MKMKVRFITGLVVFSLMIVISVQAQQEVRPAQQQIRAAVSAAPGNMQEDATVLGYSSEVQLVTLREGTGELICLADDPKDSRFHVACYFKELEPFMKRGRELRAEGKSRDEVYNTRQSEIESGKLSLPDKPMALYSLTGPEDGFDYIKGTVRQARPLRVVYVPYATIESTGISGNPAGPGAPWLMDPGKPWAHIMIPGMAIEGEKED